MNGKSITAAVVFTVLCVASASGRVLNVPRQFNAIQNAIDAARAGDTVLVWPGVYRENVAFRGEGAVLASKILTTGNPAYIDSTIIDAGGNDCGISIEVDTGYVRGFTIRNGVQTYGGGVDCRGGVQVIEDMVVHSCAARLWGGGLYVTRSANVIVRRVRSFNNEADFGGGVGVVNSPVKFEDCEITGNRATTAGGGLANLEAESQLSFKRVLVADNTAPDVGGMRLTLGSFDLNQVAITGNRSENEGGVGGLCGFGGVAGRIVLTNCIIYDNPGEVQVALEPGDTALTVAYSDIEGGREQIRGGGEHGIVWGQGVLNSDPRFVNAREGDYHLAGNSPCIDAGDPNERDPDGTAPEMGAYQIIQRSFLIGGTVWDDLRSEIIGGASVAVTRGAATILRQRTDAEGRWGSLAPLWSDPLSITVTVQMNRYAQWSEQFEVNENDTLEVESRLAQGVLSVQEDTLSKVLAAGDSAIIAIELGNAGNASLHWSASWQSKGRLVGEPGRILARASIGVQTGDDLMRGVVFDGEHYYIAGANRPDSSLIYVFDTLLSQRLFQQ